MSRIGRKSIPVPAGVDVTISGQTVKVEGEELLVMREEDVMGVIEGTAAGKKKAAA